MKLHFRILGEGHPLIILHGVFGSSDNWQTVGKELSKDFRVHLVDLRNHGKSPHSDVFNYEVMADDVAELMADEKLREAHILGHSMGGKVAMALASRYPKSISKLIVVDIAPKHYPPHHQQIFEGFKSVDLRKVANRKEADEKMAKVIDNIGVRQFILKNLDRDENGSFKWKLNLKIIEQNANVIGSGIDRPVQFPGETLFLRGSKSDYVLNEDHKLIHSSFPNSQIETIEGAGHWVHAEKPRELYLSVLNFLK